MQYSGRSTNIFNGAGNHQVRYGVGLEDVDFSRIFGRTGPTFTLPNGQVTTTGGRINVISDPVFGRIYRVDRANYGETPITHQKYLYAFLQDTWQVGQKLTVRPGLRWERQRLVGGAPSGAHPCHVDDSLPGAADGTGPTKPCEFTFDNNWGPRIGATYDITGSGRSKLFASWGRFYARIPNDLAVRALNADAGISRADYFDANLTQPIPAGVRAGNVTTHLVIAGSSPSIIDPKAKTTFQNELSGGFEFQALRNASLGIRYIHRNMPRTLEDIGTAGIVSFEFDPSQTVEYFITNPRAGYPVVKATCAGCPANYVQPQFEDIVHKYDAVEVTANKTFSDNWSLIASYRWSRLKGNYEGFFRSDNLQSDPAITSLFDFPTSDPNYTGIGAPLFGYLGDIRYQGCSLGCGVLPNDRPHQVKVYATYQFKDLNLGVGFNAGSGRSLTALASNPNYNNAGEIPMTLRGAGIQTVDGFLRRTKFETTLDVHADYGVRFGGRRVVLLADVFNLINRQEPLNYDNYVDQSVGAPNPNFGQPTNGGISSAPGFQVPRSVRLGARVEW
jgi:hypothetical protein